MANITRFRPASDALDDLFRGFFMQPVFFDGQPEMQMKVEVSEDDRAYLVQAELPGVKKEDIHVSIDGSQVTISAEIKKEREAKEKERVLRSERYYGSVSRTFALESEIDEASAEARYRDGILELTLPKKKATSARKLVIQ